MRALAVAVGIVLAVVFASLSALRTAALLASPVRPIGDILTGLVSGLLAITFLVAALRAARHGNALIHPATRKAFRCIAKGMRARDWDVSVEELLDSTGATAGRSDGWPRLLAFSRAVDANQAGVARQVLTEMLAHAEEFDGSLTYDLWLQGALYAALVDNDSKVARDRLNRIPAPRPGPFSGWREYPLLAESAVLLSEGDEQLARKRLVEWKTAMSSGGGRFAATGNHWAVDILTERLKGTATSK